MRDIIFALVLTVFAMIGTALAETNVSPPPADPPKDMMPAMHMKMCMTNIQFQKHFVEPKLLFPAFTSVGQFDKDGTVQIAYANRWQELFIVHHQGETACVIDVFIGTAATFSWSLFERFANQ